MKKKCKIISTIFSIIICVFLVNSPAYAADIHIGEEQTYDQTILSHIIPMEDGSFIIDEINITDSDANNIALAATTYQKSATRTYTYYDKSNRKCWSFILKGTFQYNGSSSKAIAASTSYTTYVTGWSCNARNASYSGNTAKGTATFKHLTAPVYIEIGLRCSASGTISKVNY